MDSNGNMLEELNYDPCGKRRNPQDWSYTNVTGPTYTERGFTGHEHVDQFNLIDMNGRIFDPEISRFLSPDPVVQNPYNLLNYNRYSYCLNNPLKFTDPSGYGYQKIMEDYYRDLQNYGPGTYMSNNYPGAWSAYMSSLQKGYQGGYGNFVTQYYNALSTSQTSTGNNGTNGFKITWETNFTYTNGTRQEIRDKNGNLIGILLPEVGVGVEKHSIFISDLQSTRAKQSESKFEMIALFSEVGKLVSETSKEAGFIATIGDNGKFYWNWTTGNQYVKVFSVAEGAAYGFFFVGAAVNIYQYSQGEISGGKLTANLLINGAAIVIGGIPGIILGGGYMIIDKTVGWDRMMTPVSNDQWSPNRAVFPDGTTIYVCFKAGTQICTKDGLKPIEQMAIGDSVYSYNLDKNTIELSKVIESFKRKTKEIYELTTDNQKVYVTAEHPFYVEGKGWVKVKNLQIGFELKTKSGSTEHVVDIRCSKYPEVVYNIEVAGNHNYFVTKSSILVHNK